MVRFWDSANSDLLVGFFAKHGPERERLATMWSNEPCKLLVTSSKIGTDGRAKKAMLMQCVFELILPLQLDIMIT